MTDRDRVDEQCAETVAAALAFVHAGHTDAHRRRSAGQHRPAFPVSRLRFCPIDLWHFLR